MWARVPSCGRLCVSYSMSDSISCIRQVKENDTENRSDKPADVGPVCPPATRGGPAAPLHPERRRPAEHRGPAAAPQQAGLRVAAMRASLPGPPAGSGRVRSAGLNLLAAIIIYWNTLKLGETVFARKNAGLEIPAEFLAHISPLGWEHINLTGEYRWPGTDRRGNAKRLT